MSDQQPGLGTAAPVVPVSGPISISEGAQRLARLGFLVINGSSPATPGGAQLIVALRDQPTLEHFDPEIVQHWDAQRGKGKIVDVTRATPLPVHRPFSWGTIRATDRLEVYNSFLTFGGDLVADRVDAHQVVCVFRSPAPIVRWTGHSQDVDPLAGEIGAFFARMMVPVDFTPGAEERIAALTAVELYAAFLTSVERRRARARHLDPNYADDQVTRILLPEAHRIRNDASAAWAVGTALAEELRLDGG